MNERQIEIIVSRGIESVLGAGHSLVAQQLAIASGRLDLLVSSPTGEFIVVELKKGRLATQHLDQALRYSQALEQSTGKTVRAMAIANAAGPRVLTDAESRNVCIKILSEDSLDAIRRRIGLSDADLLGSRRKAGVLYGGTSTGTGLHALMPLESALAKCPHPIRKLVECFAAQRTSAEFSAGKMQIALHYRGCKIGGLNRMHRGGHTYVTSGVVLSAAHERELGRLRFRRELKRQSGGHDHIWWERRWRDGDYAGDSCDAFAFFCDVIDNALS